jgi:(p)ppGpp synthase/HD superfamily hydrolase
MEEIFRAVEWAAKAHRGQVRKGSGVPYIIHPLGVARILIEHQCAEKIAIAGLLHDVVEDTEFELRDIETSFGADVAALVEAASEPNRAAEWEERKEHTIRYLETAPQEALWVVCADKLDNARSLCDDQERLGSALWSRFNRPKVQQAWYYNALVEVLARRMQRGEAAHLHARLAAVVRQVFVGA